ncbi:MAG: type VI secretion system tip protein VgrG, partial [Planctomycetes bacterium]|nr:type VI secretion system tip protein VgrG [Planctomycetota bacterium]
IVYQAVLVPRLWRLSLTFQNRIFQNLTIGDIIEKVLTAQGFASGADYELMLEETYPDREYTVQYQETDLNFISRLMEHAGIYYFFDHRDGCDKLIITDKQTNLERIEGRSELKYAKTSGAIPDEPETVEEFTGQVQLITGEVCLKDYNYRDPETVLVSEQQLSSDIEMPGMDYEYGQHSKNQGEGDRLAQVRMEEIGC